MLVEIYSSELTFWPIWTNLLLSENISTIYKTFHVPFYRKETKIEFLWNAIAYCESWEENYRLACAFARYIPFRQIFVPYLSFYIENSEDSKRCADVFLRLLISVKFKKCKISIATMSMMNETREQWWLIKSQISKLKKFKCYSFEINKFRRITFSEIISLWANLCENLGENAVKIFEKHSGVSGWSGKNYSSQLVCQ